MRNADETDRMDFEFDLFKLPANNIKREAPPVPKRTPKDIPKCLEEAQKNSGVLEIRGEKHVVQLKDLEVLEEINHGSSGTVYRCKWEGEVMAVKSMPRTGDLETMSKVLMDLDVIRMASACPHIVRFYGYFITEGDIKICMERMATCFDSLLRKMKATDPSARIPENILGKMSVSVVNALHYLKTNHKIMHRDIKPSNILLDWRGVVKLCDFGISRRLVDSRAYTRQAGCYYYMAPERFNVDASSYDIRSDVWSLGITLVELATGKYPYSGNDCAIASEIVHGAIPRLPSIEDNDGEGLQFSPMFHDFVERCLQRDPKDRSNFDELLHHPFILHHVAEETDMEDWLEELMS